jgi:hypothetical protein
MNDCQPTRREYLLALFLLLMTGLSGQNGSAEELVWIGGAGNSWHTPENWAPIDVLGEDPIQRIPHEGDTVVLADTTHGRTVRLDGDSPRLAGIEIASGMELDTNNHLLLVDDSGLGATVIRGERSQLTVRNSSQPLGFRTDLLDVLDSASLVLEDRSRFNRPEDATVQVLHNAVIDPDSLLTGYGLAAFGHEMTPGDSIMLRNEGTIRPRRGPTAEDLGFLRIATRGGALIDFDGESNAGIIDADEPGRVYLDAGNARSLPFSGTLLIGGGDYVNSLDEMEGVTIEFSAPQGETGTLSDFSKQMQLSASSNIHVRSGGGSIAANTYPPEQPGFQMIGGSIRVDEHAGFGLGASDDFAYFELQDVAVYLDDDSSLAFQGDATLNSAEIHLVGEAKTGALVVPTGSRVTINSSSIDPNRSSPGFDGMILMRGGILTVNVPGGWELDGRLELDNIRNNEINGSTITVDGGEPGDGIYSGGEWTTTINADVVLTENAYIYVDYEPIYFNGNVTSYRPELGSGYGSLVFRGEMTTLAVPTILNIFASFQGGTVVLDHDLTISDRIVDLRDPPSLYVDKETTVAGPGRIVNKGGLRIANGAHVESGVVNEQDAEFTLYRGAIIDSLIANNGILTIPPAYSPAEDLPATAAVFDQRAMGTLRVSVGTHVGTPALRVEHEVALSGTLELTRHPTTPTPLGLRVEILSAPEGITGGFAEYNVFEPDEGFWRLHTDPTSIWLEVIEVLQGDYNGNGLVEQADLDLVLSHWGASAATPPDAWIHDLPAGIIDQDELDRVLSGWGARAVLPRETASAAPVPEPAPGILAVLLIGAALLGRARSQILCQRNVTSRPPASFQAAAQSPREDSGA